MPELRTASGLRVIDPPDVQTARLRRRMHSPLCGLMPQLGYLMRSRGGPRMIVSGADLTGVHVVRGQPRPKVGSYHIGGYGTRPYESQIRTLGEVAERYAGYMGHLNRRLPVTFVPASELPGPYLDPTLVTPFADDQYAAAGFPFVRPRSGAPYGWARARDLATAEQTWVPAQHLLVGYVVRDLEGEPWTQAAVSTGTAAHTGPDRAALGALHEIIQIDATMGHWYGAGRSIRILAGRRTAAVDRILRRHLDPAAPPAEFHLLPSPDLPGFTIACILRERGGQLPAVAVGLGADALLEPAMYKAFLEAVGVRQLAIWVSVTDRIDGTPAGPELAGDKMFDLESNVAYAATTAGSQVVEERFASCTPASCDDLPADLVQPPEQLVKTLVAAFTGTGKRLYAVDITTADIAALGFVVARFYCPHTLPLSLPGAPMAGHPRYADFGGIRRRAPHPYP